MSTQKKKLHTQKKSKEKNPTRQLVTEKKKIKEKKKKRKPTRNRERKDQRKKRKKKLTRWRLGDEFQHEGYSWKLIL